MLTILRLLCLIVSKPGTACAFRVMNDIDSRPTFIGNGDSLVSEVFSDGKKIKDNQSIVQLSVLQ